jgi:hypothetical protein
MDCPVLVLGDAHHAMLCTVNTVTALLFRRGSIHPSTVNLTDFHVSAMELWTF